MINLSSLMIGTMQVDVMGKFYEKIVGRAPDMKEEKWYGWSVGNTFLSVGEHSEMAGMNKNPARVMFTFETAEVKEEFERMKTAGATVVKEPYQMETAWIATLADPDGNYFQLMTPWDDVNNKPKE